MLESECRNIIFMIDFLHCTNMLSYLAHLLGFKEAAKSVSSWAASYYTYPN